jgi:hypothetical protein
MTVLSSWPQLDAVPKVRAVRERLKTQYSPARGYEVRPGNGDDAFDLEVSYNGRPVHYYVIHDALGWDHLCARMSRCVDHARSVNATVWLAVPAARLDDARELSDPSLSGPRVCSYRENGGELYLEWW